MGWKDRERRGVEKGRDERERRRGRITGEQESARRERE